MRGGGVDDVESGLPVSREPPRAAGAVVRRVEDDVDEASRRFCQARGHVVDEGTRRCCQHRSCVDRRLVGVDEASHQVYRTQGHIVNEDTHRCCQHRACGEGEPVRAGRAMSEGPAEEDSTMVAAPISMG